MLVAVMRFDLHIPGAHSLKQKRHVLKSLIAALRSKFNVSVAEVDHQDLWQRTTLAVASTAAEGHHVRVVMQRVERFVEAWGEVEVIGADLTLHDPEG